MNPQNYNQIPQGQPTAQSYGSTAQARAMAAAHPVAQPMQRPTMPTAQVAHPGYNGATLPQAGTPGAPAQLAMAQNPTLAGQVRAVQPTVNQMPTPQPMVNQPQPAMQPPLNAPQQQPVVASQPAMVPAAPQIVENPLSTQATLMFSELRDSLVIMKDGSFRAVVACQSINFDLMSETEREGVEYSYQNFLNSLNFTVQILVRSQRVDIGPYIERLIQMRRNNDNMLLGVLMDDYINFIDVLAQEANIMDKSFFIVIPYYASADLEAAVQQTKNFFKTFSKNKGPNVTRINRDVYNKAIDELNNRVETVISGLFQIGIQSVRLNTKELSELFYNFNNPDTAVREPLVDFTKLATTYVKKGTKE